MPELPEVETVRLTLGPLVGRRVDDITCSGLPLRLGQQVPVARLEDAALGRRVEAVRRLGKYLVIDFKGSGLSALVHLGMSGRLRLMSKNEPEPPHTHVVWHLAGKTNPDLRFSDPRRFGQVDVVVRGDEREHPALSKLGPDPLIEGVDAGELYQRARRTSRSLKLFLLDQQVIAGVGNIYASEALHEARIHPAVRANKLSRPRMKTLARAVVLVMKNALERGGTSLRDFVNAEGHQGDNSHYLRVYDRAGQPCLRRGCSGTIRRTVIQGRATFHCPTCQKR